MDAPLQALNRPEADTRLRCQLSLAEKRLLPQIFQTRHRYRYCRQYGVISQGVWQVNFSLLTAGL